MDSEEHSDLELTPKQEKFVAKTIDRLLGVTAADKEKAKRLERSINWARHSSYWPQVRHDVIDLLWNKSHEEVQEFARTWDWNTHVFPGMTPQKTRFEPGQVVWAYENKRMSTYFYRKVFRGPYFFMGSVRDRGDSASVRLVIDETGHMFKRHSLKTVEEREEWLRTIPR